MKGLTVRDKVTRQCPQITIIFEGRGEPKRNRTEALNPLTSLTPYRQVFWWLVVWNTVLPNTERTAVRVAAGVSVTGDTDGESWGVSDW